MAPNRCCCCCHSNTYRGGVGAFRVVLQHARQPEVGHFALQLAVDEDVAGGQVAVDVVHVGEVLHALRDATQHAHQLVRGQLTIVVLQTGVE